MNQFSLVGNRVSPFVTWFTAGLKQCFVQKGYVYLPNPVDDIQLVFNVLSMDNVRPYRRKAQATFVVSILEGEDDQALANVAALKKVYPFLVRSLSNHFIYLSRCTTHTDLFFITPEQGCYKLQYTPNDNETIFFERVYQRLEPLASSRLVINNEFVPDLPEHLWQGDEFTEQLRVSGKRLDLLNLLPAPFPLDQFVSERDMRHIKKLYGIGGLSYGNLSCRTERTSFWMSASGVNKADMRVVGQDMLLIRNYDKAKNAMMISVPPKVEAKRASVDAIEHWMIYSEHAKVGAIVHVHAWMDGIQATEMNYPCGTLQLAEAVAQLVREAENPARAIIGLKNHGLTITGYDLDDIFERIEGKLLPHVPMS